MDNPSSASSARTAGEPAQRSSRDCQKRNEAFQPKKEPFRHTHQLEIRHSTATGPFSFLNPTSAHFRAKQGVSGKDTDETKPLTKTSTVPGVDYKWNSRNNRKGRHALAVDPSVAQSTPTHEYPQSSGSAHVIARNITRMFTTYPIWDVSYLVAIVFTLGSIVWVINAIFVFLPLVQPSTEFGTESLYGGGITAFIGATIFEFGSFLLMAEAVNENRTGCFGWALEQLEEDLREKRSDAHNRVRIVPSKSACTHHHGNKHNLVGKPASGPSQNDLQSADNDHTATYGQADTKSWVWWPGWYELRTHYLHELGFLACLSQLFGATIFWISGLTALPGIYDHMSTGLTAGIYWTPQVIGGSGFIVSGVLFMIETQKKWYIPAFNVLGWHIGLWNLIGGIGFTLCPCFGYSSKSWAQYQACLSTFWASWAFLIGSVVQWYESLDKNPVETMSLDDVEGKS